MRHTTNNSRRRAAPVAALLAGASLAASPLGLAQSAPANLSPSLGGFRADADSVSNLNSNAGSSKASISFLPNDLIRLRFNTVAPETYEIQSSTDLSRWVTFSRITANSPMMDVVITNNRQPACFFRLMPVSPTSGGLLVSGAGNSAATERVVAKEMQPAASLMAQAATPAPKPIYTFVFPKTVNTSGADLGTVQQRRQIWDLADIVTTIQGLVNRDGPNFYLFGSEGARDAFWFNYAANVDGWLANRPTNNLPDMASVIQTFQDKIAGAVIWDENVPATADVAASVAALENLVPVRYDTNSGTAYQLLVGSKLLPARRWLIQTNGNPLFTGSGTIPGTKVASTKSAKCDAYYWLLENYLNAGKMAGDTIGYREDSWWINQPTNTTAANLLEYDYVIMRTNFMFDLSPWSNVLPPDSPHEPLGTDLKIRLALLGRHATNNHLNFCKLVGFSIPDKYVNKTEKDAAVFTENQESRVFGSFNCYHSIGASANSSFFHYYPLAARYPQTNLPTVASLKKLGYLTSQGKLARNMIFIGVYMGDYDGVYLQEYLYRLLNTNNASSIPVSFGICPGLEETFPIGLVYAYRQMSAHDNLVAGSSGTGYLNPGELNSRSYGNLPNDVGHWATYSAPYFKRWDMSLTGFIVEGTGGPLTSSILRSYAAFSPAGMTTQPIAAAKFVGTANTPVIQMDPNYMNGKSPEFVATNITAELKGKISPSNRIFAYRFILYSPAEIEQTYTLMQAAMKKAEPNYTLHFVDLHTMMLLLKASQ